MSTHQNRTQARNAAKPPKTSIFFRPGLEAKRRPVDGMWCLWAHLTLAEAREGDELARWSQVDDRLPFASYTGWWPVATGRTVKEMLAAAPAPFGA